MLKKISLLILIILFIGSGIYYFVKNREFSTIQSKFQISASFYPYYFFASEIVGDKARVINITPAGAEPHDYEPTTGDIITIESSKILIINGIVEPWAVKIKSDLKSQTPAIIEAGNNLFTQKVFDETGNWSIDPHIWLDPVLAKKQVKTILDGLLKVDSKNSNYYHNNADKFISELDDLDKSYRIGLTNCQSKDIVTSHAAFGYLASEYGLKQVSIAGLSPDSEPSLKQLTEVANFAKKNNIKYIFFESLVSPKLSETIASEIGAKTLVLNPLEGLTPSEFSSGKNYLTIMRDNLASLRIALQCR